MTNTDRLAQACQSALDCLICSCKPAGNVDVDDTGEIQRTVEQLRAALASLAPAAVEGDAVNHACDAYDEAAESDVAVDPPSCDMRYMIPALAAAFPALTAQVAALTAQCDNWKKAYETCEESLGIMHTQHKEESMRIDELTAQCEGLRKDAERYRWLKLRVPNLLTGVAHSEHVSGPTSSEPDGAIDSAIAAGNDK